MRPGTSTDDAEDHAWMADARCRRLSTATFFPSTSSGVEAARDICAGCPVRVECLNYALDHRADHGVWGGESERERQRIMRRRRDRETRVRLLNRLRVSGP
jgi:WhiB family redox-sensing transcriptional regulator